MPEIGYEIQVGGPKANKTAVKISRAQSHDYQKWATFRTFWVCLAVVIVTMIVGISVSVTHDAPTNRDKYVACVKYSDNKADC